MERRRRRGWGVFFFGGGSSLWMFFFFFCVFFGCVLVLWWWFDFRNKLLKMCGNQLKVVSLGPRFRLLTLYLSFLSLVHHPRKKGSETHEKNAHHFYPSHRPHEHLYLYKGQKKRVFRIFFNFSPFFPRFSLSSTRLGPLPGDPGLAEPRLGGGHDGGRCERCPSLGAGDQPVGRRGKERNSNGTSMNIFVFLGAFAKK